MGSSFEHFATYYLPKISSGLSIFGSTIVLGEIIADLVHRRRRRSRRGVSSVYRILASVCVGDILNSSAWFLGTWAAPSELEYLEGTNHGSEGTCRFQGFLLTLGGLTSILFTATLAVFYLLMVKYKWTEETGLHKLQVRIQVVLWTLCFISAMIPLFNDGYHNGGPVCQVDSYPRDCTPSWQLSEDEETDCTAGDNAGFYRQIMTFFTACGSMLANAVIFAVIYCQMHQLEQAQAASLRQQQQQQQQQQEQEQEIVIGDTNAKRMMTSTAGLDLEDNTMEHAPSPPSQCTSNSQTNSSVTTSRSQRRKGSYLVAREGMLYILGFLLVFCPWGVNVAVYMSTGEWNVPLDRISVFLACLQGVWNYGVFSRQRRMKTCLGKHATKLLRCRRYARAIAAVWAASDLASETTTLEPPQQQQRGGGMPPPYPPVFIHKQHRRGDNRSKDRSVSFADEQEEQAPDEREESSTFRMVQDNSNNTRMMVVQWTHHQAAQQLVSDLGTSEVCYSEADHKWEPSREQHLQDHSSHKDDSAPFRPVRIQTETSSLNSSVFMDEKYPSDTSLGGLMSTSSHSSSNTRRSRNSSQTKESTKDSAPARPIRTISEVSELESIAEYPELVTVPSKQQNTPVGSLLSLESEVSAMGLESIFEEMNTDAASIKISELGTMATSSSHRSLQDSQKDSVPSRPRRAESELEAVSDHVPRQPLRYSSEFSAGTTDSDSDSDGEREAFED